MLSGPFDPVARTYRDTPYWCNIVIIKRCWRNVTICLQNGGKCNFAVDSAQTLTVVPCECAPGYGGDFCQLDIDGCADQPCFSGVLCTDVAAPDLSSHPDGFLCGTCPVGLSGDGSSCIGG